MFPHEYGTTTQNDTRRRDRALREAYDRDEMAYVPTKGPRRGRVWLGVLLAVLITAAAYGVWWIATNDDLTLEIGSAVEAPVAVLRAPLG